MSEFLSSILPFVAGVMLGAFFFGGLWWTVQKGLSSKHPALWFLGSMFLRTGVSLAGFYFVAGGHWQRLLLCLFGFIMARLAVMWLTRPSRGNQTHTIQEPRHAS